ncbi:ribonuclease S-2-like [Tripterygium wilfordii]|uniref:ribonuclease S-2-like n=1 Tax=Tripterygium wilfordii TaxID=458696 RepID=UPI0018F8589C|nr:ribonuclease S-2-like [Tripterygium wilfordii]
MATKIAINLQILLIIIVIVLIIIYFDASDARKRAKRRSVNNGSFHFYKTSLRWPRTYCNTKSRKSCETPIVSRFLVHGLWPAYLNPHETVPPFNISGCTTTQPTPKYVVPSQASFFGSRIQDKKTYWSDPIEYSNMETNMRAWKYQWVNHGMCWAYPVEPLLYFDAPVDYIKNHDLLQILAAAGPTIIPVTDHKYDRDHIAQTLIDAIGGIPEIDCYQNDLWQIRVCFDKSNQVMNCPIKFHTGCNQDIGFPPA